MITFGEEQIRKASPGHGIPSQNDGIGNEFEYEEKIVGVKFSEVIKVC